MAIDKQVNNIEKYERALNFHSTVYEESAEPTASKDRRKRRELVGRKMSEETFRFNFLREWSIKLWPEDPSVDRIQEFKLLELEAKKDLEKAMSP
mmetsp:Transcript_14498/g.18296  ORF Transcript_14498/g.18296 Transcript_14498/m.18296 type:complete len:95 (-) Transcript_14498:46-330(-)